MQTQTDQASYEIAIHANITRQSKNYLLLPKPIIIGGLLMGIQARLTAPLRTVNKAIATQRKLC